MPNQLEQIDSEQVNKQSLLLERLERLSSKNWTNEDSPAPSGPIRLPRARRPLIFEFLQRDGRSVFDFDRQEQVALARQVLGAGIGCGLAYAVGREVPGIVDAIGTGISNGIAGIGEAIAGLPDVSAGTAAKFVVRELPIQYIKGMIDGAQITFSCALNSPSCGDHATLGNIVRSGLSGAVTLWGERRFGLLSQGTKALLTKGGGTE